MKEKFLSVLLALAMAAGCSGGTRDGTAHRDDLDAPDATEEQAEAIVAAGGIPAGYMVAPGGVRVHKSCVEVVPAGTPMTRKTTPCPKKAIKPAATKKTMPVDPNTLTGEGSSFAYNAESQAAPSEVAPGYSFNIPNEWLAATGSDWLVSTPNQGQKSQGNITRFTSTFQVPYGGNGGDQGQLIYLASRVMKWGGVYPTFTDVYGQIGGFLQQGWNGMWGSWQWTYWHYADQGNGWWSYEGPIYQGPGLEPGQTLLNIQASANVNVPGPDWGFTRWTISTNNQLYFDYDYANPFDMNFMFSTFEFYNVPQRFELMPNTRSILFSSRFHGSQKNCIPGIEPPAPWWYCGEAEVNQPNWRQVGTGGTIANWRWTSSKTGTSTYRFDFVPW